MPMKRFLFSSLLVLSCLTGLGTRMWAAQGDDTANLLYQQLATARNSSDSIRILYDIFDVLPVKERVEVGEQIYRKAGRSGKKADQIDILRLMSLCFEDDASLKKIEEEMKSLPPSKQREENILYVKMRRVMLRAKRLPEAERQKEIVRLLNRFDSGQESEGIYKILDLYALVEYMRNDASGDMLNEYLDRLIEMVNAPDFDLYAVKNNVYSEASEIYADAGDYEKAISVNRKEKEMLDKIEKSYREKGRNFRNFDMSRYLYYRRMLRFAKGLNPAEVEKYYREAMKIADSNETIKKEIEENPRITAYYYMAIGDYNSALPILKKLTKIHHRLPVNKEILEMLILAADKTGDDKTKMESLEKYNLLLQQINERKTAEKARELQIKYDLQDLKNRNKILEIEKRDEEIESTKSIMVFVTCAFVVIFMILLVLLYNWSRYKRNTHRLGQVVDNIHHERHRLRNSLYAQIHDDGVAERYPGKIWEKRMKEAKESRRNATIFMTESIVNDLLYISAAGHQDMMKYLRYETVDTLLRHVETNAKELPAYNRKLSLIFPENDYKIFTDTECLSNLLIHMAGVAMSYAPESKIGLECERLDSKYVGFIITIYGIGAAEKEGPQLFRNIPMSDIMLHHEDSGLYLCRMISLLLQCEFKPVLNYTEGARYVLRVPVKMSE